MDFHGKVPLQQWSLKWLMVSLTRFHVQSLPGTLNHVLEVLLLPEAPPNHGFTTVVAYSSGNDGGSWWFPFGSDHVWCYFYSEMVGFHNGAGTIPWLSTFHLTPLDLSNAGYEDVFGSGSGGHFI